MPSWLNRVKRYLLNGRARCLLMITLGLLLIAGELGFGREELAARAVLPPPLPVAPPTAGAPQLRTETVSPTLKQDRSISSPPAIRIDPSTSNRRSGNLGLPYRRTTA